MKINQMIDHTKLGPKVSLKDIDKLILEAKTYEFKSVCVDPIYVKYAKEKLLDSNVLVCSVVGFPSGTHELEVKVFEARRNLENGADEIDMVINQNNLINNDQESVLNEIKAVKKVCGKKVLKVIIEASNLDENQKILACKLAVLGGADYVKTSTGFSGHGAKVEDIILMRKVVGPHIGVKASGGIRTYEDAVTLVNAGATRIGASSSVAIMLNKKEDKNDSDSAY